MVKSLAFHKAKEVAALPSSRGAAVLGADTVVALDGRILGKPKDEEDAFEMLSALSGRVHEVFTASASFVPQGTRRKKRRFAARARSWNSKRFPRRLSALT